MNIFKFKASSGVESACGLEIHENALRTVIVLTELDDNPGISVTNAVERIAELVCARFNKKNLKEKTVKDCTCVWVEHYPETSGGDESFDFVYFKTRKNGTFFSPEWKRTTKEQVDRLIAGEKITKKIH